MATKTKTIFLDGEDFFYDITNVILAINGKDACVSSRLSQYFSLIDVSISSSNESLVDFIKTYPFLLADIRPDAIRLLDFFASGDNVHYDLVIFHHVSPNLDLLIASQLSCWYYTNLLSYYTNVRLCFINNLNKVISYLNSYKNPYTKKALLVSSDKRIEQLWIKLGNYCLSQSTTNVDDIINIIRNE